MDRIYKLRQALSERQLDGMLILQPENRRYLSGFTGSSAALLITAEKALLFTDFRYLEQAKLQAPQFEVVRHEQVMWDSIVPYTNALAQVGFEQDFVSFALHETLTEKFNCRLVPVGTLLEELRLVKDEAELDKLQKAAELADAAFKHILSFIKPGMTERQIALELEFYMRQKGASGPSFDFIVASGSRSSLPHGVASDKVIQKGDYVTMDFGCIFDGYCSDITRTVVVGKPSDRQREIYQIVLEAQLAALDGIKPGKTGQEVDRIARDIIGAKGYGDYFGHGLGHGVGLAIHEEPRLSPSGMRVLEPGMVVTDEPGIYLPEWGGVRIEDTVVLTGNGARRLTNSSKDLIVL